jgi:hypothetical protein
VKREKNNKKEFKIEVKKTNRYGKYWAWPCKEWNRKLYMGEWSVGKGTCDKEIGVTEETKCCSLRKWEDVRRQWRSYHSTYRICLQGNKSIQCHEGSGTWGEFRDLFVGSSQVSKACVIVLPSSDSQMWPQWNRVQCRPQWLSLQRAQTIILHGDHVVIIL